MGRWEPDARTRLERSALELFEERGYEQTTVTEIAARAGLTERTFFRHFADKREVLFSGSPRLVELMVTAVADAPSTSGPQAAVRCGLARAATFFEDRRSYARRRQHVLDANPVLAERELRKLANLTDALADALRVRGADDADATLTAEVAVLVFRVGFGRWLVDDRPMAEAFDETYARLGMLAGA